MHLFERLSPESKLQPNGPRHGSVWALAAKAVRSPLADAQQVGQSRHADARPHYVSSGTPRDAHFTHQPATTGQIRQTHGGRSRIRHEMYRLTGGP